MKKRIFALLMAMVLVFGMSTTVLADINSPVGDNTPPTQEVVELDVKWSTTNPWWIETEQVTPPEGAATQYFVDIIKDGEYIDNTGLWEVVDGKVVFDVSYMIGANGTGKYSAYVSVVDMRTYTVLGTGVSDVAVYEKPEKQLATPGNVKIDPETYELTFDKVEGAVAYDVWVSEYMGSNEFTWRPERCDSNKVDMSWLVDEIGWLKSEYENSDIELYVGVCAVSEDLTKVAYSDISKVLVYEQKQTAEQVKENFDKAFENIEQEPWEAATVLYQVSNETLVEMIKTDADFSQKVEKLDTIFAEMLEEEGIYKGATSKTDIVDASKVKVVGIALNAVNGMIEESVELSFAKPEKEAVVPEGYKKGVQLDISLLVDGEALEDLSVPVAITMPIPTGVDTKDLVILHYHGDATEPVVIVPTVNADGTMTFIVDGFSTFVVTNQVVEATAPKTGDSSTTVAICSLLLLAAGVVLMKRNAFAK